MALLLMILMVGMTTTSVMVDEKAVPLPPCFNQLFPCTNYFHSTTKPPDTCCNLVKDVNAIQRTCLCSIALSPHLLPSFGLNVSQGILLLHSCGVDLDLSLCKASISALPPSSSVQPPATRGGDEGGADRITFTVLGFVLLFIWPFVFLR